MVSYDNEKVSHKSGRSDALVESVEAQMQSVQGPDLRHSSVRREQLVIPSL